MLVLVIQTLLLANILQKIEPQVLNYDIKNIEINVSKIGTNKTEKHSALSRFGLLYNETECSSSSTPSITGKTAKVLRSNSFDVKSDDFQGKRSKTIKNLKSYVDINKEGFAENGIEFDLRKREDAYKKTNPKEYPYAVSLIYFVKDYIDAAPTDQKIICSGSLLTDEWVLTAGHCIFNKFKENGKIYVYAGGNSVEEAFQHLIRHKPLPLNSQLLMSTTSVADKGDNDIGLIKLPAKFNITDTVKPVNLSSKPWKYHGYQPCVTTSFGDVSFEEKSYDDNTRKTHELEVKQPCLCSFWLQILTKNYHSQELFMCSKPRQDYGVCTGDSGGGLVCDGKVLAVNMALVRFEDVKYCDINYLGILKSQYFGGKTLVNCGGKNTLSVFQPVCPSLGFINKHVKLFSDSEISECMNRSVIDSASVRTLEHFSYSVIVTGITIAYYLQFCK